MLENSYRSGCVENSSVGISRSINLRKSLWQKCSGYPSHSICGESPNFADSYVLAIDFVVGPGFEEDMQDTMLARRKRKRFLNDSDRMDSDNC